MTDNTNWLGVYKHLLPRAKAWGLTYVEKFLRKLFEGLTPLPSTAKTFIDQIWEDMFADTTREMTAWELQWGLPDQASFLGAAGRESRLEAVWTLEGGQSPSYIQNAIQTYGFDTVYIHEWWVPGTDPPEARNPVAELTDKHAECGEPWMECGEPAAACGNYIPNYYAYWLVNKLYFASRDFTAACGEPGIECGEPAAACGEWSGFREDPLDYPIPSDSDSYPYFLYFGGAVFGNTALVPEDRQDEFENLLLKLCPAQHWIGLFIEYVGPT